MTDANLGKILELGSPLCVFCLSPPFSIRAVTPPRKIPSRRYRRRGDFCPPTTVRRRFKPSNRRSSNTLLKNLAGVLAANNSNKRKTLSLKEVLGVIQRAWRPQLHVERRNSAIMDEKQRKSSNLSTEIPSPILIRRRLSAPETIMRKHMLAQQRSDSQDSDTTQASDSKSRQWRSEIEAGSESNLSTKRDSDLMRRSTLLRRFWSNSKPFGSSRFSGTFYEWQHSFGKLSSGRSSHSLTSIHSSPEHLMKSQSKRSLNGSPQHKPSARKLSPIHQNSSNNNSTPARRKISVYESNFESYTTSYCSDDINSNNNRTTITTTTPKTVTDGETNTGYTTFSDNSDSAYTNSRSNFSRTSNNNSTRSSEISKQIIEEAEVPNEDINQVSLKLRSNNQSHNEYIKYTSSVSEMSTQTHENTNVNVISNVHLSQSTLDLIFNQVMQDVQKAVPDSGPNVKSQAKLKPVPSFYLKQPRNETSNDQHNQIVKYMISNVGTGSPYGKPAEVPQVVVPRYSALPRTTSMEVNISSGDSTDKESDTISLADSLEDSSAFQTDAVNVTSDSSVLLPDNSQKPAEIGKPTAFFIPIEVQDQSGFSAVSDHLPDKVRSRLVKRQQKREEKLKSKQSSPRSDSNYASASDNGNQIHQGAISPDINLNNASSSYNKTKKRSKPLLPSIKTFRRIKIDKPDEDRSKRGNKATKRKTQPDNGKPKPNHWIPSIRNKEKLSPVYTTKSEYVYDNDGPKKFYHKTEFNNSSKRIEILEIMECLEPPDKLTPHLSKTKSRIPVLVNHKLPKVESPKIKAAKPTFLDLTSSQITDPKLDQLIANILIETLNSPNLERSPSPRTSRIFLAPDCKTSEPAKHLSSPNKYQQKFEAIPEELSFQSSCEDLQNDRSPNNNEAKNNNDEGSYQGKAAIAVIKDENFSSIPKGKELDNAYKACSNYANKGAVRHNVACNNDGRDFSVNSMQEKCRLARTNDNFSSSSDNMTKTALHSSNGRGKKFNYQRKQRFKTNGEGEKPKEFGDWSVTVSGTNSYGQFAPDLQMCLKFPDHNKNYTCPSQSDSGLGEENERRLQFPKINTRTERGGRTECNNENVPFNQRLPDIGRNQLMKKHRKCESSIPPLNAVVPSKMEPRQTRTSLRRYNLTRPKIDYHQSDSSRSNYSLFDSKNYADILKHLPDILSITGNAISPDSKSPY